MQSLMAQLSALPDANAGVSSGQSDPEAVIRRFYEFANAGDTEAQNVLWADDATLTFPDGTVLQGKDEVITFAPGHVRIDISDLRVDGNIVRWISTVEGSAYHLEAEVVNGRIQRMAFVNPSQSTPCQENTERVSALPTPDHRCS
jgi:hypothetical protein